MMKPTNAALPSLLTACALVACRGDALPDAGPARRDAAANVGTSPAEAPRVIYADLVRTTDCSFGDRGPLLDFGEPGLTLRGAFLEDLAPERIEREGATFARIRDKVIVAQFFVSADEERSLVEPSAVAIRWRGAAAKSASVYLNGKPLGSAKLERGAIQVADVRGTSTLLNAGLNDLTVRFATPPKAERDAMAEVDWIHVTAGEVDKHFAAPTARDVIVDRSFAGTMRKAMALKNGGYARCTGFLPAASQLEVEVAAEGVGDVEVEVRLQRDRASPVLLGKVQGSATRPSRQAFPLDPHVAGGTLGAIELAVVKAAKGARALLGEPRITLRPREATPPRAALQTAVLVVFGTVDPRSLAAFGGTLGTEGFSQLARDGTSFASQRVGSTLASATVAAMLTGRGPRSIRMEDGDARLPASVTTVADAARQAGVVTALFSGNPMTSAPFGFDRSWETFSPSAPEADVSGVKPFDDAIQWLKARKGERALLVVHARGGHPPWGATADEQKRMPPEVYTGGLDPKHAAELMSKARRVPPQLRFSDADRTRAFALHAAAVVEQDRALARLLVALRDTGRGDRSLVMVTSDVGVNSAAPVPFGDGEAPTEMLLTTPLIVRAPGQFAAGQTVASATADVDVAKTLLGALGLAAPRAFEGHDLWDVAQTPLTTLGRARLATVLGRHSLRWGSFLLDATDRRQSLCDISLEPLCTTDVRPTHPLALSMMEKRLAALKHSESAGGAQREPVAVDATLQAALRAWGR